MGWVHDAAEKIRAINRTYAVPKVHLSRSAKVVLVILRIYLFALVGLLLYTLVTRLGY
jgi:hypothetical protein